MNVASWMGEWLAPVVYNIGQQWAEGKCVYGKKNEKHIMNIHSSINWIYMLLAMKSSCLLRR
jgi:hypothetical protein